MSLAWLWYIIVGVLIIGYAVLDGFDLGIGVLSPFLAKDEGERSILRAAIGPVWDGNEVWLITAGGALFAAFPFAYAFAFSGFYLAIMLVLFGLILRAVSLEFRHRDQRWGKLWDACFFVGSLLPALLLGCAVGNLIRGVPMSSGLGMAPGAGPDYAGTFWGLLNPFSLLCGVVGLSMFVLQGAAWATLKTEGALHERAARVRSRAQVAFIVLVVATTVAAIFVERDQVHANVTSVIGWIMVVLLVAGVAWARRAMTKGRDLSVFLGSSLAVVGLLGLWGNGNWPFLVRERGVSGPLSGIQATQYHSSHLTLVVMLIIAVIGMPLVIAYTAYVYRLFKGKVRADQSEY